MLQQDAGEQAAAVWRGLLASHWHAACIAPTDGKHFPPLRWAATIAHLRRVQQEALLPAALRVLVRPDRCLRHLCAKQRSAAAAATAAASASAVDTAVAAAVCLRAAAGAVCCAAVAVTL